MQENNLRQRASSAALWEGIHTGGSTAIGFVSTIILARLLTPADYGYFGMLAIFVAISDVLVNGGFGQALIQKKKPTDEDYSTIFYWNVFVSLTLYVLLFFAAPSIARFYNMPMLAAVLRVEGISIILNAFRLVQKNILTKTLQFKTLAIVEISVTLFALVIEIYMAWKGYGVWSLVVYFLVINFITLVVYWLLAEWRPKAVFSWRSFKEMFAFGGYMLLTSLVDQIYCNIQGLIIGKRYSAATLGYYSKAQNAETISASLISKVGTNVSFPVLAELQHNQGLLLNAVRKMLRIMMFVTIPMMMLLFLIAEPLFVMLYSDRWIGSVPYFRILVFMGIFTCIEGISTNSIAALGRGKVYFRQNVLKKSIGIGLIFVGVYAYGIVGLAAAMVIASFINYIVNGIMLRKQIHYGFRMLAKDSFPIVVLTMIAFVAGLLLVLIPNVNMYVRMLMQTVVFMAIYLGGAWLLKIDSMYFLIETAQGIIHKIRR